MILTLDEVLGRACINEQGQAGIVIGRKVHRNPAQGWTYIGVPIGTSGAWQSRAPRLATLAEVAALYNDDAVGNANIGFTGT